MQKQQFYKNQSQLLAKENRELNEYKKSLNESVFHNRNAYEKCSKNMKAISAGSDLSPNSQFSNNLF